MSERGRAVYRKAADFQTAIVEARFELDVQGPYEAILSRVVLGAFRLLRVEERSARQATVSLPDKCVLIAFPTEGASRQTWDNVETRRGELLFFGPGASFHHSLSGRGSWAWIVAEPHSLSKWRRIFSGWEPDLPQSSSILRPSSKVFKKLDRLHEEAASLSVSNPEFLEHGEVLRSLEQELIQAIVTALASQKSRNDPQEQD